MHPDLVGIIFQKILSKTHLCLQLRSFLLFSVLSLGQEWELFRAFLLQPVWEALSHLLLFHQALAVAGSTTFTEQKQGKQQSLAKRGVCTCGFRMAPLSTTQVLLPRSIVFRIGASILYSTRARNWQGLCATHTNQIELPSYLLLASYKASIPPTS